MRARSAARAACACGSGDDVLIFGDQTFLGTVLELHPKRLGEGYGVEVRNLRPGSADLRGWSGAPIVHVLPISGSQRTSLYRMGRATPSDIAYWLTSVNDVDYVRSLNADDATERTYYTGESEARITDNVIGLAGEPYPTAYRTLGVPAPSGIITLAPLSAGSGTASTRSYLDTFVTDKGEEGAPNSAPQNISIAASGTVQGSNLPPAPAGPNGITLRRIYVSENNSDYRRIVQQAASLTTFQDTLQTRGTVLPSGGSTSRPAWLEPPTGLRGLIELWDGMIGGFVGKSLRVCHPYQFHAWPFEYENVITDDIVGTGTFQRTWVVLTTGKPRLFQGSSPASLSEVPAPFKRSCIAKRGILSMDSGVAYPSEEGLAWIGTDGERLVTAGIMTPQQWRTFNPETMVAARVERFYYASYSDDLGARRAFIIDPVNPQGFIHIDQPAFGAFYDTLQEQLYLLDSGNVIRKWNGGSPMTPLFRRGVKRMPMRTNAGAVQIVADTYPVQFRLWGDGVLRYQGSIANGEPQALPGDFLDQDFQYEVTGGPVQAVLVGEDVSDLRV